MKTEEGAASSRDLNPQGVCTLLGGRKFETTIVIFIRILYINDDGGRGRSEGARRR